MKTKVKLINGYPHYQQVGQDIPVEPENLLRMYARMKSAQTDLYISGCKELSCQVVEGRVYEVDQSEMDLHGVFEYVKLTPQGQIFSTTVVDLSKLNSEGEPLTALIPGHYVE